MNILILLILALDIRVFGYYDQEYKVTDTNEVKVVNYDEMGQGECPKIKEPLCASNGEEYAYFENKCLLEVRNYERLLQGLQEYFECPLDLCNTQCPPCGPVYDPVCAVEQLTGEKQEFHNSCEVQRRICNTGRDWQIVSPENCATSSSNKAFDLQSQDPECPELCTLEYQPICARFMTLQKEFSNECELKTTICQTKQEWNIIRHGPCEITEPITALDLTPEITNCPIFCTLEYSPICAQFGNELREFANKCELETTKCYMQQDWQIVKNGPCNRSPEAVETKALAEPSKFQCPKICTLEYQPICAKYEHDIREFANKCELESTICETEQDWQIINNGPCSPPESDLNVKAVFASIAKPKCPEFCTLEYRPLCARFDHELREFPNACALERTICETNKNWQVVHQGTCNSLPLEQPKCPEFCTFEYRPLCAKFNNELREFPNHCALERTNCHNKENWQIVNQGKCLLEQDEQCPQICTLEYRPICAKFNNELREFPNECDLRRTICETKKEWQILKQGPCIAEPSLAVSECPQFCTDDYNPVCAEFNKEQKEFPNNCDLLRTICETNNKWEVIKLGPCSTSNFARSQSVALKSPITDQCPKFCTREYNPLCAKSGEELREFSNKCVWQTFNCETGEKWEFVNWGHCPSNEPVLLSKQETCPKGCTLEYRPVCAKSDNELREFPNKCELLRANCQSDKDWEIVFLGRCPSSPKTLLASTASECPRFCTREYIPLCAQLRGELREFPNKCEFQRRKCKSNEDWEIVNLGTCPSNFPISAASAVECPKFCTREYIPLCAQLEEELREFPNKCEFQRTNCATDKKWEIVNLGTCPSNARSFQAISIDCPKFCTREYIPLCAELQGELREFPNKCEFLRRKCESNEDWEIVNLGTCPSNSAISTASAAECPKFCTREYIPLCAQLNDELREFPNKCEFLRRKCESNEDWEIVNLGTCPSNSPSLLAFKPECPKFCTLEYNPVCGQRDDELKEFPNKCEYLRTNCETEKSWTLLNLGKCPSPSCPEVCTEDFRPVCAEFEGELREFGNKCDYEKTVCQTNTDWKLVNEGPCSAIPKSSQICPKFCTKEFDPVCGRFNGELTEFSNPCEFQRIVCETKKDYELVNNGPCLIKTAKSSSINLQPLCATYEKIHKIFHDLFELQEEIKSTGKVWTVVHIDNCLAPSNPKPETNKPEYIPKAPSKPKYPESPISKSYYTTSTTTQHPYSYSREENSQELNDSSKGYNGDNVSHASDESYEDSEEDIDNENYNSWEDEDEDDEIESEEEENSKHSYEIDEENDKTKPCEDSSNGNISGNNGKGEYPTYNSEDKYTGLSNEETNSDYGKEETNYSKDSNSYQKSPSEGQHYQDEYSKKHNSEDYKENFPTDYDSKSQPLDLLNPKILPQKVMKKGKSFIKLIQERIWEIFGSKEQDEDKENNKQDKPKYDKKENLENLTNQDESLEANISYEDEENLAKPQVNHPYETAGAAETQPKFGVYNDDAYDLNEAKPQSSEDHKDCNDFNSNQEMDSYNTASNYEGNQQINNQQYLQEPQVNNAHNNEYNDQQIFENFKEQSNYELESNGETTAVYSVYEDTENQLNYTKREEYPSKYNATSMKKGEIYNGVVYKAPVYDAPTYNFIYTAPNHPILPLTSNNNPFFNSPQNPTNPADLATNPAIEGVPGNLPFNPMHFLTSLAAMSSQFVAATPNLMHQTPLAIDNANALTANNPNQEFAAKNPLVGLPNMPSNPFAAMTGQFVAATPNLMHPIPSGIENANILSKNNPNQDYTPNNPSVGLTNLPLQPFALQNLQQNLPQTPTPTSQQMFTHLAPFNNINAQLPNLPPLIPNHLAKETGENSAGQHFPAPLPPVYHNPINAQQQLPPLLAPNLAQPSPAPYQQPSGAAFNATVFNKILESLKTITNSY